MSERPYTVLSCCISLDGYLDGPGRAPLRLSNDEDLDRVDGIRAACDAILVGARTVRRDDPRLLVRSPERRAVRVAAGLPASPTKVTITTSGVLDPASRFCTAGRAERLVYCASAAAAATGTRLGDAATVVDAGQQPTMQWVVEDLFGRGVRTLMVEGGGAVLTQLLVAGLADELRLAIAPVFVGDRRGSRFVGEGRFPWSAAERADLMGTRAIGDVAVLTYALSGRARDGTPRESSQSLRGTVSEYS
jgi:5-amino-6-(5-phosphoribosylamino)uracil reductase